VKERLLYLSSERGEGRKEKRCRGGSEKHQQRFIYPLVSIFWEGDKKKGFLRGKGGRKSRRIVKKESLKIRDEFEEVSDRCSSQVMGEGTYSFFMHLWGRFPSLEEKRGEGRR